MSYVMNGNYVIMTIWSEDTLLSIKRIKKTKRKEKKKKKKRNQGSHTRENRGCCAISTHIAIGSAK